MTLENCLTISIKAKIPLPYEPEILLTLPRDKKFPSKCTRLSGMKPWLWGPHSYTRFFLGHPSISHLEVPPWPSLRAGVRVPPSDILFCITPWEESCLQMVGVTHAKYFEGLTLTGLPFSQDTSRCSSGG